jgi:hypothetical protein
VAGQSVKTGRAQVRQALADGLAELLDRMGRTTTVPAPEIATLVCSMVDGLGLQLASGEPPALVEPAWAGFWAALLSLTRPA